MSHTLGTILMTEPTPAGVLLKVGAGTSSTTLAQAITHAVMEHGEVHLRSIGAGAGGQVTKALTIARGHVAQRGGDLWYCSGWVNVPGKEEGTTISAIQFRAKIF
jgi:stage V sporulation protein SpoVS